MAPRDLPKNAKALLAKYTPEQMAGMLIELQASRDLLARLAEESGDKLHLINVRIATLESENAMFRARDKWLPAVFPLEDDPRLEGDDE